MDDFAVGARTIILRKLAKRPLRLADFRQDAAFDHDLRMGGHANRIGSAFDHFDRLAEQRAGDFHFIVIERRNGLRRQNAGRMHADHQRDLQRFAGFLRHAEIMSRVPRQQQHADAIGAADLAAMDRDVLNAGRRISGNQQRRRNIRAAVVFVVLWDRQLPQQVDVAVNHVMHRRRRHLDPRQRMADGVLEPGQQLPTGNAEGVRDPAAIGEQIGDHRNVVLTRLGEQDGALQLKLFGHRRQFVDQRNAVAGDHKPVGRDQPL